MVRLVKLLESIISFTVVENYRFCAHRCYLPILFHFQFPAKLRCTSLNIEVGVLVVVQRRVILFEIVALGVELVLVHGVISSPILIAPVLIPFLGILAILELLGENSVFYIVFRSVTGVFCSVLIFRLIFKLIWVFPLVFHLYIFAIGGENVGMLQTHLFIFHMHIWHVFFFFGSRLQLEVHCLFTVTKVCLVWSIFHVSLALDFQIENIIKGKLFASHFKKTFFLQFTLS